MRKAVHIAFLLTLEHSSVQLIPRTSFMQCPLH